MGWRVRATGVRGGNVPRKCDFPGNVPPGMQQIGETFRGNATLGPGEPDVPPLLQQELSHSGGTLAVLLQNAGTFGRSGPERAGPDKSASP